MPLMPSSCVTGPMLSKGVKNLSLVLLLGVEVCWGQGLARAGGVVVLPVEVMPLRVLRLPVACSLWYLCCTRGDEGSVS